MVTSTGCADFPNEYVVAHSIATRISRLNKWRRFVLGMPQVSANVNWPVSIRSIFHRYIGLCAASLGNMVISLNKPPKPPVKGGRPSTATPADRRLAANKPKPAKPTKAPKKPFPGAAEPFKPKKS